MDCEKCGGGLVLIGRDRYECVDCGNVYHRREIEAPPGARYSGPTVYDSRRQRR
jgi:tRNA(Ile2) C34 agmatinyltransferase TiaS